MPYKGDKGDKNAARPPEGSLVETRCLIKGPKSAIVPFPGPRSGPKSRTGPGALAGRLAVMTACDVLFAYNPFKTYGLLKWTNDLVLTENIQIFLASLTTHIIIFLPKEISENNYILNEVFKRYQTKSRKSYILLIEKGCSIQNHTKITECYIYLRNFEELNQHYC